MRVVLTRERGRNGSLASRLPVETDVVEVPLTRTELYDVDVVRRTLDELISAGPFRALVVTSARSAPYASLARTALAGGSSVLCVGPATARALEEWGVDVDTVGRGGAVSLAPAIHDGPVLVLGARRMGPELAAALRGRDISVATLACYETVPEVLTAEQIDALARADVVFVGAPSAWAVARRVVRERTWVVVPGATTAAAVRATHERVVEGWSKTATLLTTL